MQFDSSTKDQIIAVWKPLGISTHTISKQVSQLLQTPVAHTGTLDPMAEGVIVLLSGEERFKKYELAGWKKEYEFEILFGLSTDTYDLMGFLQQTDFDFKLDKAYLAKTVTAFTKTYSQKYPPFSAKKVKGKPLHYYAQQNTLDEVEIPTLTATIFELELLGTQHVTPNEIYKSATTKIKQVDGFFRQQEILADWELFQQKVPTSKVFSAATLRAVVSRGVYVRTLAVDIAEHMHTVALVSNLIRTKNGDFSHENCVEYKQILDLLPLAE